MLNKEKISKENNTSKNINLTNSNFITSDEKEYEENTPSKKENTPENISRRKIITGGIGAISIATLGAFGVKFIIEPKLDNGKADDKLKNLYKLNAPIRVLNKNMINYPSKKLLQGVNKEQKALSIDSKNITQGFIFSNGKVNNSKKNIDVYIDVDNQRNKDFIGLNASTLQYLVHQGFIDLTIHIVPTSNPFSLIKGEALAEASTLNSFQTWEYFNKIAILDDSSYNVTTLKNKLVELAKKYNINGMTNESLSNGTFSSWLLSTEDDKRLKTNHYPPLIYKSGNIVDTSSININDSSTLERILIQ